MALSDFLILLSKLGNRKFIPTGICDKGDGLVAVHGKDYGLIEYDHDDHSHFQTP